MNTPTVSNTLDAIDVERAQDQLMAAIVALRVARVERETALMVFNVANDRLSNADSNLFLAKDQLREVTDKLAGTVRQ